MMINKMKHAAMMVTLAGATGAMVALTAASPAAAAPVRGPQPVSTHLTAVRANTSSWVNIYWRTDRPVCSARVQVDGGRQVAIAYPGMRRATTFTRGGGALRPGRIAATPVQVSPRLRTGGVVVLRAVMAYTDCGRHARTQITRASLVLPVIRNIRPGMPGHNTGPGHNLPGQNGPGHNTGPGHTGPGSHHGQPVQGGPGHASVR